MPHPTTPAAVRHPETGQYVVLDPAVDYEPDNVLVKAYSWAFTVREHSTDIVESVSVEQASAAPGEKRSRSRKS